MFCAHRDSISLKYLLFWILCSVGLLHQIVTDRCRSLLAPETSMQPGAFLIKDFGNDLVHFSVTIENPQNMLFPILLGFGANKSIPYNSMDEIFFKLLKHIHSRIFQIFSMAGDFGHNDNMQTSSLA
eukprot:TRINITY_DN13638_c0_g1_i1.p2 TRINITY_DN13638_c0_g1~~TRINITY_DN13638_c0_g1_i1.p2  ORF type:complete len:127 (-),score=14.46 TRINITY_DN13638_c0_g1_i1:135-515(-)